MEQCRRIAGEVRVARATLSMSRLEVSRRAGVAPSTVNRVEAGDPSVQLDTMTAVMTAVGLDLVLRAYEGGTPSLRDTGQMELGDRLRRTASPYWRPRLEVAAGEFGHSADLVMYGAEEILHLEIERSATDFQAQMRSALRKREVLASADARPVRLILVIEDTSRNRDALRPHAALVRSQLPATSREILRSIRRGEPLGRDGLLWLRRYGPLPSPSAISLRLGRSIGQDFA